MANPPSAQIVTGKREQLAGWAFLLGLFVLLYGLVWRQVGGEVYLSMRGVWGDWGHHIGLPIYYHDLNQTTWSSPFTAGVNFTYSFLNSFIPTALLHWQWPIRWALTVTGVIWSVAWCMLVLVLGKRLDLGRFLPLWIVTGKQAV